MKVTLDTFVFPLGPPHSALRVQAGHGLHFRPETWFTLLFT
jgi:hypothetical protein